MSRELTEKKQRNIRGDKAVVEPKTIQEPTEDLRTPYTGDINAVITGASEKNLIPTSQLLNTYIKCLKDGIHEKVESKAESDRFWLKMFNDKSSLRLLPDGWTLDDYKECVKQTMPPIPHNYHYNFTNGYYDPVDFTITKVGKTYGFTRQDTGECCNFTIVKDKLRDRFTFKLQPLDEFNLPEWVGG